MHDGREQSIRKSLLKLKYAIPRILFLLKRCFPISFFTVRFKRNESNLDLISFADPSLQLILNAGKTYSVDEHPKGHIYEPLGGRPLGTEHVKKWPQWISVATKSLCVW
jgi:hypothetical protein